MEKRKLDKPKLKKVRHLKNIILLMMKLEKSSIWTRDYRFFLRAELTKLN